MESSSFVFRPWRLRMVREDSACRSPGMVDHNATKCTVFPRNSSHRLLSIISFPRALHGRRRVSSLAWRIATRRRYHIPSRSTSLPLSQPAAPASFPSTYLVRHADFIGHLLLGAHIRLFVVAHKSVSGGGVLVGNGWPFARRFDVDVHRITLLGGDHDHDGKCIVPLRKGPPRTCILRSSGLTLKSRALRTRLGFKRCSSSALLLPHSYDGARRQQTPGPPGSFPLWVSADLGKGRERRAMKIRIRFWT